MTTTSDSTLDAHITDG